MVAPIPSFPVRLAACVCLALAATLWWGAARTDDGLLFAVVAKSVSDQNFVRVHRAANQEAARHGDRVILVGGSGQAHFRRQDQAVREVMTLNPDGLAISVLRGYYLAENSFAAVRRAGVPVITFDSDFEEGYTNLRLGYVGTDNHRLGVVLAEETHRLKPTGGRFAILTGGPDDTNLNQRINGVLSGLDVADPHSPWTQYRRSPLPCRDDYEQSLSQLEALMEDPSIDAIISVGWWAQMAPDYAERMAPYRQRIESGDKVLVFAGGDPKQLETLRMGLAHVNVDLDFEAMGRAVYRTLKKAAEGEPVPPVTHTPLRVHRAADSCP